MSTDYLAVDLGGTKTTLARIRLAGDGAASAVPAVTGRRTIATRAGAGPAAILTDLTTELADLAAGARADGAVLAGIGVGSAGVIDSATGRVTSATDAIPGWAGTDLAGELSSRLGLATHVLNDVHAHGLGEATFGAGRGQGSMLLVAVGTGIGGAFVHAGEVVLGAHSAAAHLGHVPVPEADGIACPCGRSGHLEGLASGPGIHSAYLRAGGTASDTREIAARAPSEPLAREVLTTCARATGRVIGGLLNVFDPDVVIVSGGLAGAGPLWWDSVRAGVAHDAMPLVADTPLVPANAGADAALLGAAQFASTRIS